MSKQLSGNQGKQQNKQVNIGKFVKELGEGGNNSSKVIEEYAAETGIFPPSSPSGGNKQYSQGKGKNGSSMKEEFAKEANFPKKAARQPSLGKIDTDPDIANVNNHEVQLSKTKGKNGGDGFTKMIEEIADEVGLFKSDKKQSSGKSKMGSEFEQIKEKIMKPFKKE